MDQTRNMRRNLSDMPISYQNDFKNNEDLVDIIIVLPNIKSTAQIQRNLNYSIASQEKLKPD